MTDCYCSKLILYIYDIYLYMIYIYIDIYIYIYLNHIVSFSLKPKFHEIPVVCGYTPILVMHRPISALRCRAGNFGGWIVLIFMEHPTKTDDFGVFLQPPNIERPFSMVPSMWNSQTKPWFLREHKRNKGEWISKNGLMILKIMQNNMLPSHIGCKW